MACIMLCHASLPSSFWGEAIASSINLLNHSFTKVVDDMTLEELFIGHKPTISHLHVFGCATHVHVPSHKRRTLETKSKTMIFTRYASHSKGF